MSKNNNATDNTNQKLKEYIAKCECEYKAAIKSWSCKAILDAWTRLKCARTEYNEQMNILITGGWDGKLKKRVQAKKVLDITGYM